jgi:hypothetical protein
MQQDAACCNLSGRALQWSGMQQKGGNPRARELSVSLNAVLPLFFILDVGYGVRRAA